MQRYLEAGRGVMTPARLAATDNVLQGCAVNLREKNVNSTNTPCSFSSKQPWTGPSEKCWGGPCTHRTGLGLVILASYGHVLALLCRFWVLRGFWVRGGDRNACSVTNSPLCGSWFGS